MVMPAFTVQGLTSIIAGVLPEPHAGLLAGLMFGTKMAVSKELYNALVTSGTLHIIALSGMNITIMEDLVGTMLLPFVGRRVASLLTIGAVCWFVWFVGPSPSVVRAAIMGSLTLIAVIFGRQYWAFLSWGLAVAVMLVIHFSWLFEISFQLSALATLGIILFGVRSAEVANKNIDPSSVSGASAPSATLQRESEAGQHFVGSPLTRPIHWIWLLIKDNLHLTLAAQVFTIPLILFHFHRVSLIAPLANLAIGWVIAPLTVMGWLTVFVGFFFPSASYVIGWIDWVFLEYLVRAISLAGLVSYASLGR